MASFKLTEMNPLPETEWPSDKTDESSPEEQLAAGYVTRDRADPRFLRYDKEPRGLAPPAYDPRSPFPYDD